MRHLFRANVLVAFAVVTLLASAASADDKDPPRTISTSGESVVYVVPDEAVVTVGIESFAASLDQAKAANAEASSKLVKAIKALNIEPKHIQTDNLQIEIHYKERSHPTLGIEGY